MDVATGAMASLLPKLEDLLKEKYKLQRRCRKDVKYLSKEMKSINAALLEFAKVPGDQLDLSVKHWAKDARKLSYDMEIIVAEFMRPPSTVGLIEKIKRLIDFLNCKRIQTPLNIFTDEIKHIKARVQSMATKLNTFRIHDVVANPTATTFMDPRLTDHDRRRYLDRIHEVDVDREGGEYLVGLRGEKYQELLDLLIDGDDEPNEKLKVVSVVGLKGSGKTTLVKTVYDRIGSRFDRKAFVVAGQNPNPVKILMDIISQFGVNYRRMLDADDDARDERKIIEQLREFFQNERYLIVIDDIPNENIWEQMKYAFSNERNLGSRIITTTRMVSVSKVCCSSTNDSVYQMEPLSVDDSKQLFYKRIPSWSECRDEHTQVSRDILKKCRGLPSAIAAVALLAAGPKMDTMAAWHALLELTDEEFIQYSGMEDMQRILSFSYHDLPHHLKSCLLYLSIFPRKHTIEKDRLVKKWISDEIVSRQEIMVIGSFDGIATKLSLEEVASQYLDELVNRNVIQLQENNNVEVITIHPMIHNRIKAIAIEEKFAASIDGKNEMDFPHISIDFSDSENLASSSNMSFSGDVRSFTVFGHANQSLLGHFKVTRVLDLESCKSIETVDLEHICSMVLLTWLCLAKTDITELPPKIGKLKCLEGLDVGGTQITQLPPEIAKLQRLKTLDARKSRVKKLPREVFELTELVHLLIGDSESCEGVKLPDYGILSMRSLQQLGIIDLSKCSASSLNELGELRYIKEIVVVASDEPEDTGKRNALLSSLNSFISNKPVVYSEFRLSTLHSSSTYSYLNCRKKLSVTRSLNVPTGFAGQNFLRMVDIRVCKLDGDDLKILGDMPRLQSLIVRLEVIPTKMIHISCRGFAKLESLYVDCRMPRVIFEKGAMPKLGHLELKLYAGSASKERMCIKHLLNLQKVLVRFSEWYATNMGVRDTIDAVKTEAKEHQNEIIFCIAEEDKDGKRTMKTKIFQENKDAICSKMTETEEEDRDADRAGYFLNNDTQEGDVHHSSRDIASCSGTSEIEEVVE